MDLYADIIDSRGIIELIDEVEGEYDGLAEITTGNKDFKEAVLAMIGSNDDRIEDYVRAKAFEAEAKDYVEDWQYGASLIKDSYFTDYAQQLAEDIGAVDKDAPWPNNHIDWDAAVKELQQDYTEITVDGDTYWVR